MRRQLDDQVEVAGRPSARARLPLPGEPDALAVQHPLRDVHRIRLHAPRARVGERDLTAAAARRLLEGQRQPRLGVGAGRHAAAAPARRAPAPEARAPGARTEEHLEEVAEVPGAGEGEAPAQA